MIINNLHLTTLGSRPIRWIAGGFLTATIVLAGCFSTVLADDEINTSTGMTIVGAPLAIHGYDPVAYFTEGRALVGKAVYTATHDDAAYRFISQANKEKFEANPDRYVPQYGGFCAFGVSVGAKFDGDPRLFRIVDGKLYFNLNPEIRAQWIKDIPGNIKKANRNWTQIGDKAVSELS